MRKSLWSGLLLVVLFGLTACGQVSGPNETSSPPKTVKTHKQSYSKRNSSSSAVNSAQHPYADDTQDSLWTVQQDDELAKFMSSWQASMDQHFVGTYDGKRVDYLGFVYPNVIDHTWRDEIVYDQNARLSWYHANEDLGKARFRVMAAAVGGKGGHYWPVLYLFALDTQDNSPVVLVSETTNGGTLWFYETQNDQLKDGFSQILRENSTVSDVNVSAADWTQSTAIDYLRQLDSKDAALQTAVIAVLHDPGPDWDRSDFTAHGRTAQLHDQYGTTWSLTHLANGKTVVIQRIPQQEDPAVVFYATDRDHLVYEGYHNGEPIVDTNVQ
ncbi:DUF4767 domain-containing protein [Lacticaseibacillus sp. N501-2]|uniref:DUF4767 domain-containing protein n=1 Tax=Lacticaseibacillus salsurae TaxID=3367729 RepID=UPI0038B31872